MTVTTTNPLATPLTNHSLSEQNSYDKLPYTSYPFEICSPELIRSRGILFGMNPPELKTARILELGCSDGGNMMRFAETYPQSYSLGIDLSEAQIEHGKQKINQLNLKNIELKAMSITDLDESYGTFDYIICHGVYSWVPEFVRQKILSLSKQLLSKNGIAMVSYNTLPGWNMNNAIRDIMTYHTQNFQDGFKKVEQAKFMLSFLNEALESDKSPYSNFMRDISTELSDKEDSYILHEYLIGENKSYYFHEFIKDARSHGLEYLSETDLPKMYIGNLPPMIQEKFLAMKDIIELEQYLDFINNIPFRSTLLCHQGSHINRNITETLKKFYICSEFGTNEPENETTYTNGQNLIFYPQRQNKNITINTSSPAFKAVAYTLMKNIGNPLKIDEIVDEASKRVPHIPKEHIEQEFISTLVQLVFSGHLRIFADKPIFSYAVSNKPKVSLLAASQNSLHTPTGKYWITSQINSVIGLEPFAIYVIKLLDGEHSLDQIKAEIFQKLKDGVIKAHQNNQQIEDEKTLRELADFTVMNILDILRVNFGLVG